jgi:hypothetical protein
MGLSDHMRAEPHPTIVGRLIEHGVLREGGRGSLGLAVELAAQARITRFPVDAVAQVLRRTPGVLERVDDPGDVVIAAGAVVDVVIAHDAGIVQADP